VRLGLAAVIVYGSFCADCLSQTRQNAEIWSNIAHQPTHDSIRQAELGAGVRPPSNEYRREDAELRQFSRVLLQDVKAPAPGRADVHRPQPKGK
jgi:hypothetical protein